MREAKQVQFRNNSVWRFSVGFVHYVLHGKAIFGELLLCLVDKSGLLSDSAHVESSYPIFGLVLGGCGFF